MQPLFSFYLYRWFRTFLLLSPRCSILWGIFGLVLWVCIVLVTFFIVIVSKIIDDYNVTVQIYFFL